MWQPSMEKDILDWSYQHLFQETPFFLKQDREADVLMNEGGTLKSQLKILENGTRLNACVVQADIEAMVPLMICSSKPPSQSR